MVFHLRNLYFFKFHRKRMLAISTERLAKTPDDFIQMKIIFYFKKTNDIWHVSVTRKLLRKMGDDRYQRNKYFDAFSKHRPLP